MPRTQTLADPQAYPPQPPPITIILPEPTVVIIYGCYHNTPGMLLQPLPKISNFSLYLFTFLCYTSIHSLRTAYSYAKKDIALHIDIDIKYMGIVDSLMLAFLGLGHFLHALYPIKKPVKSLWIGMLLCGVNYGLIPLCLQADILASIYVLAVLMCVNGFLQSYTWPNLLMIINSRFSSEQHPVLLGFWATNANFGNIIGYGIFEVLMAVECVEYCWQIGLAVASLYAIANGLVAAVSFEELPIAPSRDVRQKSIMHYDTKGVKARNLLMDDEAIVESIADLEQNLLEGKSRSVKSVKSAAMSLGRLSANDSLGQFSRRSVRTLQNISSKLRRGAIKSIKIVDQPQKVAQTPLSVIQVFKDPNIVLLTITFSLTKSVIYGLMLWLPIYFKSQQRLKDYATKIPITYDIGAIVGSVAIGYLFKKIINKGFLMIPFMVTLFICFFLLKFTEAEVVAYFAIIAIVGFALGGIFNTLSGLVVCQLTKVIPQNLKSSSLGFYSALTMAVGNITTAVTQVLIGFVIGKQNQQGIFLVFMVYAAINFVCLCGIGYITYQQKGQLSKGEVLVIEEVQNDSDDSGGEEEVVKVGPGAEGRKSEGKSEEEKINKTQSDI